MPLEIFIFGLVPAIIGISLVIASVFLALRSRNVFQVSCAIGIAIAVYFSLLWLYRMFFTRAWPSYLPYFVIGVGVCALFSQIGFYLSRPKTPRRWLTHGFSALWVGGLIAFYCNTGVERTQVVAVRWSLSDARADAYGKQVISLQGPQVSGTIASDEIAAYLKTTNPDTIPVEIIRIYDLGKLRGWTVRKIAGISNAHLWLDGQPKE